MQDRSKTIQRIQSIVTKKFGVGLRVEVFGSTRYGVDSAASDLDVVIVVRFTQCPCAHVMHSISKPPTG